MVRAKRCRNGKLACTADRPCGKCASERKEMAMKTMPKTKCKNGSLNCYDGNWCVRCAQQKFGEKPKCDNGVVDCVQGNRCVYCKKEMKAARDRTRQRMTQGVDVRQPPPYHVWRQRDGTPIFVKDMDDTHLYNTMRMIERVSARKARERTEHSVDEEFFADYLPEQVLPPVYHVMVLVAKARGIAV